MKSSKEIINHIIKKPLHSKLSELNCYNKIKAALPPHIGNSIAFIYKRDKTLFFALNHPGIKMEFDYKHNLIKSLLEKIKLYDKKCADIEIIYIKSFVTNKIDKSIDIKKPKKRYKERSNALFLIDCQNKELKELFLDIKESIKKNVNPTK